MDGDVESHELPEVLVLEAEHVGVVSTVVERRIAVRDGFVVTVTVVEDEGCDAADLGTKIKSVLQSRLPIFCLVDLIRVRLGKLGVGLAHHNTGAELRHRVHVLGQALDEGFLFSSQLTTSVDLLLQLGDLALAGELARQQQPENALRDGLSTGNSLRSHLSDLEEVVATVVDALGRVQLRGLVEHAWQASHAANDLRHGDLAEALVAVLLDEGLELSLLLGNDMLHLSLKGGGEVARLEALKIRQQRDTYLEIAESLG